MIDTLGIEYIEKYYIGTSWCDLEDEIEFTFYYCNDTREEMLDKDIANIIIIDDTKQIDNYYSVTVSKSKKTCSCIVDHIYK